MASLETHTPDAAAALLGMLSERGPGPMFDALLQALGERGGEGGSVIALDDVARLHGFLTGFESLSPDARALAERAERLLSLLRDAASESEEEALEYQQGRAQAQAFQRLGRSFQDALLLWLGHAMGVH